MQIAAHSLVELEDGTLADITPHGAEGVYPFIRHTGTFEEFVAVAEHIKTDVPLALLIKNKV
jgi:hypothetical protein